jgi:uncharacterized protein with PQ loop repeat
MEIAFLQLVAGTISSVIFAASNLPMLTKVVKTKNLASYSLSQLALANLGNLVYWLYIVSLPVGPVWFLQGFYTITTGLMLLFYLRYETCLNVLHLFKWQAYALCPVEVERTAGMNNVTGSRAP